MRKSPDSIPCHTLGPCHRIPELRQVTTQTSFKICTHFVPPLYLPYRNMVLSQSLASSYRNLFLGSIDLRYRRDGYKRNLHRQCRQWWDCASRLYQYLPPSPFSSRTQASISPSRRCPSNASKEAYMRELPLPKLASLLNMNCTTIYKQKKLLKTE